MRNFHAPGRSQVYAANGLAATSHPHASRVAIETLRAGGNAVDAGVAAAFVLNICEPAMTGLGGDCFALYSPPGGGVIAMNGSGGAPSGVDAAALRAEFGRSIPPGSAHAVSLPGAVAGLCRLQADHGKLERAQVIAPGIDAAENGVPAGPRVAFDWAIAHDNLAGAARRFFTKDGAPIGEGDLFRAPGQAEILRKVAAEGARGFYEGEVAEDMVASLRSLGGTHTLEDFASVGPEYVDPISTDYRGVGVATPPPNGQGVIALLMLNMFAELDMASLAPDGAARAHLEAEATKLAYDARDRLVSDPSTIGDGLERLLSPALASRLAGMIDPSHARTADETTADGAAAHRDTVYLAVADAEGGVLSLIYSIFRSFGSGLASERYGVLFHNRGAGFTLAEGHPNEVAPGKRPLHTIVPAMGSKDGRATLAYGVMGGGYQPLGLAHVLSGMLDFGQDLQTAIDAPRVFPDKGALQLETGYDGAIAAQLASKGHPIARPETPIGGAQAIWIDRDRGVLIGASDPRKDGCALGY